MGIELDLNLRYIFGCRSTTKLGAWTKIWIYVISRNLEIKALTSTEVMAVVRMDLFLHKLCGAKRKQSNNSRGLSWIYYFKDCLGFWGPWILIYCFHGLQGTSLLWCCSCLPCKLLRTLLFQTEENKMITSLLTRLIYKSYCRPTFRRIIRNGSTEQFSGLPYIYALLNCLICLWYGMPHISPGIILVATVNSVGAVFQLVYIGIFITYAEKAKKVLILSNFSCICTSCWYMIPYTHMNN